MQAQVLPSLLLQKSKSTGFYYFEKLSLNITDLDLKQPCCSLAINKIFGKQILNFTIHFIKDFFKQLAPSINYFHTDSFEFKVILIEAVTIVSSALNFNGLILKILPFWDLYFIILMPFANLFIICLIIQNYNLHSRFFESFNLLYEGFLDFANAAKSIQLMIRAQVYWTAWPSSLYSIFKL